MYKGLYNRRDTQCRLQPFPGSDAALAFALLHVLWRDGLIDLDFMAAHTVGWEELEPLLVDCTPAWGEAMTGVPARLIEGAAHLYGQGPSLLWLGLGLQRQPTGGNVIRACSLLPAVTGNIGKPGAGLLYLNWNFNAPSGAAWPLVADNAWPRVICMTSSCSSAAICRACAP